MGSRHFDMLVFMAASLLVAGAASAAILLLAMPAANPLLKIAAGALATALLAFPAAYFALLRPFARLMARLEDSKARLGAKTEEFRLLAEMGGMLLSSHDAEEAYSVISGAASGLFHESAGGLFIVKQNSFEAVCSWGSGAACTPGTYAAEQCWVMRTGQAHEFREGGGIACESITAGAAHNVICSPLTAHGEVMGVVQLAGRRGDVEPSKALAAVAADQIALALSNLRLREALSLQAIKDPLTGLFNRRYMAISLDRELHRARRRKAPLSLAMMDLDHFDLFNSNFGHEAGDAALREIGGFLLRSVRKEDIACRYGGEEFLVILPDTPPEKGVERAASLCSGIRRMQMTHKGQALEPLTISVGVASFPECGSTPEELLVSADEALFASKKHGRDRVTAASPAQPHPSEL